MHRRQRASMRRRGRPGSSARRRRRRRGDGLVDDLLLLGDSAPEFHQIRRLDRGHRLGVPANLRRRRTAHGPRRAAVASSTVGRAAAFRRGAAATRRRSGLPPSMLETSAVSRSISALSSAMRAPCSVGVACARRHRRSAPAMRSIACCSDLIRAVVSFTASAAAAACASAGPEQSQVTIRGELEHGRRVLVVARRLLRGGVERAFNRPWTRLRQRAAQAQDGRTAVGRALC